MECDQDRQVFHTFFVLFFFGAVPFFVVRPFWWYEMWRATTRSTKDQGQHFSRFISHGCQHNHTMMVKNPLRRPCFLSPEGWVGSWGMDTKAGHGETSAFHWKVLWTLLRRSSHRPVGTTQSGLEMEFARGGGSRENGQETKMRTFSLQAKVHANHWLPWRYVKTGQPRCGTHRGRGGLPDQLISPYENLIYSI